MKDGWVKIASFEFPHEVIVLRSKLESEGITCFTQDELTVQVHNFYSNAIGGVKLFINQTDLVRAEPILESFGIQMVKENIPSPFMVRFNQLTQKIPFFGKLQLVYRLIGLFFLFALCFALIIAFLS